MSYVLIVQPEDEKKGKGRGGGGGGGGNGDDDVYDFDGEGNPGGMEDFDIDGGEAKKPRPSQQVSNITSLYVDLK